MFRLCLKSLPAIRYRRLLSEYLDLKNGFRYQNIFACKYRGYIYRFKSTKPGLFKSLSETVNKTKKGREDVKLTDAKSQKLEEDKKLINKNKSDGHLNLGTDQSVKTVRPAEIFYKNNERKYFQSEQKNKEIRGKESLSSKKTQKTENNPLSASEDLFTNFQELLTLPQKNLFKYESKSSSKKNKNKESAIVKKSAKLKTITKKNFKYKPQPLAKNKKDPKIYENLNLLKEPEPQCDFLDLQSGKKRILIGGVNDFSPNLSKSNIQHTRSMTSQADRGIFSKKSPRKKIERLEKRLLLETPKIKAIKNRLSKMDRYWVIAAKKKRENKIPEAIMILRDRIRQQIEASKTFKYPVVMVDEPVKLAMATGGDDGRGTGGGNTSYVQRDDIPPSRVLEKVKIMNRKLKDTPYIPPIVERKKYDMKKSSGGKFYLKKMKKQKIEKVPEVKKVEEEKPVKLYSDKIREKIMKASEKYKQQVEGVQELVQEPQGVSGTVDANPVEENTQQQAEVMNAVSADTEKPPEGIIEGSKVEDVVKEEPKEEITPVQNVPDVSEVPKQKQRFPHYSHRIPVFTRSPHVWSIRPYAPPEEVPADVKPAMTLNSAMEGFNLNSDVQRIILKAKAKAMGVQVPEEERKMIQEPPKKVEEKKKVEIVRKSTFFAVKSKKKVKVKESIMSVDKAEPVILPEVVKRTRVPVRIPEHAIQNPPSTTDPNERTPTQEETARKIRKWFLYGRTGEDPKPIVEKKSNDVEINKTSGKESPLPTSEKIHPKDSKGDKKDEGKVKREGKSKEMVLEPEKREKRAKKIANPPSGFRTPRISDPRMPQKPEPQKEQKRQERILDPPSEPKPPQKPEPPKEQRRQERILDPPSEPKASQKISDPPIEDKTRVLDPPSEDRTPQKISDPPVDSRKPPKISDPPREHKSPERITDPPSEHKAPQGISEPPSEHRPPEIISDPPIQPSTPEIISDPAKESITPQKMSDTISGDKMLQKVSHPASEDRPPQKISDPLSLPTEKISDPPSEPKGPQKLSRSPSELRASEEVSDPPSEDVTSQQISDPSSEPKAPQKLSEPVRRPQAPQKITRSPSEPRKPQKNLIVETRPPQKISGSPKESKTQPRISGSATLPRTGQKIVPPPSEPKAIPKTLQPLNEPKKPQKIGDPPVEQYRVWVPSDEDFKKRLAESAKTTEKPEPRNEAAILAKKLSGLRSDIKGGRKIVMNVRKETMQVPRKPEMSLTKKPEKVVKAKVEPSRKASVEVTKTKDIARVEKKVYWKPEMDQKKGGHVVEPARKASAEVAKAKEIAKVEKNVSRKRDVDHMNVKLVDMVEPARKASVEVAKAKEVARVEKNVQQKPEINQINVKVMFEPARKASAEVAKAKEVTRVENNVQKKSEVDQMNVKVVDMVEPAPKSESVKVAKTKEVSAIEKDVQKQPETHQINDQNLKKVKIVHVVATSKAEAPAEVAKSKEVKLPPKEFERKFEEGRVHAESLGKVIAGHMVKDPKPEAAAMKAAEVVKSMEAIALAEKMLKSKKEEPIDMQRFGNIESDDVVASKQKEEPVKVMRIPSASELQAKAAENISNFNLPKIEELVKPEEKDLPYPKPILASPGSAKIDDIITSTPEIAKSMKKDPKVENEEPEVLKGAINIKLKPLSEIESLTKAVSTKPGNFEKVEDVKGTSSSSRGIDELEKIISKKIETIPCVKPKLPPYYYTPYTSSTLEPEEELTNKKKDKNDEK